MRKEIMKWLLGADWEEYWKLHDRYIREIELNLELLKENKKLLEETQDLRRKLIKEIDSETRTAKLALKVLNVNEKLERICKKNGIDVEGE